MNGFGDFRTKAVEIGTCLISNPDNEIKNICLHFKVNPLE